MIVKCGSCNLNRSLLVSFKLHANVDVSKIVVYMKHTS